MAKQTPLINNFNAGELSPNIDVRSDINKYYSGCSKLENFVPMIEGGVFRMPGTYFVAEVKDSNKKVNLIPFHFSTEQAYIIEAGPEYMRFYKDEGQILDGDGDAYEIETDYAEDDLFTLKRIQSADTMWIFHPTYPTKELTRTAHTSWTITDHQAKIGDAMNISNISKAATAVVTCTSIPTTVANGDIVYIEDVTGMTEVNDLFFTIGSVVTGASGTFTLVGVNSTGYTAYSGSGTAQKCKFGTVDHRPSCGAFFEQRLVLAGTEDDPQAIDMSATDDFNDFAIDTTLDDAALSYKLVSDKVDRIRWLLGQDFLAIGTTGGLWKLGATNSSEPLTSANVKATKQVGIGVKDIQPEMLLDAIMWVTRSGKVLRQFSYDWQQDKYVAPNMTRLAKHITKGTTLELSGIVDMDLQIEPQPILWMVRADGELLGLTYDIQDNVYPWFRVVTDGKFESVAVIRDDDEEDQVWVVVRREGVGEVSASLSASISPSKSLTTSASLSKSISKSLSQSLSASVSQSISPSVSPSASLSPSVSPSASISASVSASVSPSASISASVSASFSASVSPTASGSISPSTSASLSPSVSESISASLSPSVSASKSASISKSRSASISPTPSSSKSRSISLSRSASLSPSLSRSFTSSVSPSASEGATATYKRFIEYFKPHEFFSQIKDGFFVHSGLTFDGGAGVAITGISKASDAVVTCPGHSLVTGNNVRITGVGGMTEANRLVTQCWYVTAYTSTTVTLNANSTAWGTYETGGQIVKVQGSLGAITLTGLDHLEGKEVAILADGAVHAKKTVSSGAVTMELYANKIHAGLPYTSIVTPMKLNPQTVSGTARGKKQKVSNITACFLDTVGGKYGPDGDTLRPIPWSTGDDPELHTEDVDLTFDGDWNTSSTVCIVQDDPLPMTVTGIVPEVTVSER